MGEGAVLPGSTSEVVVAVDANGADLGPVEVAEGALMAANEGARILLFGPGERLEAVVSGCDRIEVVDAPVSVAKSANPTRAVRNNPEASIVQAARAVCEGRADAFVCAGATGAALAAGLFHIKRARGIYRPALALPLPVPGHPVILLDVGANTEARREHLVQFAFMGAALAEIVFGCRRPRVGLLSNGEEDERGSRLIVEAREQLLEQAESSDALAVVANLEGDDVVGGVADVVVTDGFTGNVALKLIEGVSTSILGAVKDVARSSPRSKLGGALLTPSLRSFRDQIDPESQGGAYLLGLRRLGVIPHGRFARRGFAQAIVRARRGAQSDLVGATELALDVAGALRRAPMSAAAASLRET